MSFYSIVLFFHITGALGLFIGIGYEWMILYNLQKVTVASSANEWAGSAKVLRQIFSISGLLILLSGIYMTIAIKNITAWIIVGFILYLFLSISGSILGAKKIKSIAQALSSESEKLSEKILKQIRDPFLHNSLKIRSSLTLGIIFMMTIKPDWVTTIVTVAVSLIVGYILTLVTK